MTMKCSVSSLQKQLFCPQCDYSSGCGTTRELRDLRTSGQDLGVRRT
jgi:hypothetical protein